MEVLTGSIVLEIEITKQDEASQKPIIDVPGDLSYSMRHWLGENPRDESWKPGPC